MTAIVREILVSRQSQSPIKHHLAYNRTKTKQTIKITKKR